MSTKKKGCIIIKGFSQYGALDFFTKEISEAFEKLGYVCYVVDVHGADVNINKVVGRLKYLCDRKNIKFALGFNAVRVDFKKGNATYPVFDCLKNNIPFVGFMVDNPFHHYPAVAELEGNVAYSFVCKEHVDIARSINKKHVAFIPHGACVSDAVKNGISVNKDIDVVFGGSIFDTKSKLYKDIIHSMDYLQKRVFDGVLEHMKHNPGHSYYQSVKYVCEQLNLNFAKDWFKQLSLNLPIADMIMKTEKRVKVLKAIADSGVKVTYYGSIPSFSDVIDHKNIDVRPPVDFGEMLNIMARSKVTLNVLPNFINGAHERIFSAMANKSLCLTDGNEFVCSQFTDGENILIYDYDSLDKIGEKITHVLKNQDMYNEIVKNAEKKVMDNFTWYNAAEAVVKLAESAAVQ